MFEMSKNSDLSQKKPSSIDQTISIHKIIKGDEYPRGSRGCREIRAGDQSPNHLLSEEVQPETEGYILSEPLKPKPRAKRFSDEACNECGENPKDMW